MIRFLSFLFLITSTWASSAQQSLLTLANNGLDYKKAVKLAQELDRPILAVLYSPDVPSTATNSFQNIKQTIEDAGFIGISIDWAKAPNKKPQKKIINPIDGNISGKLSLPNPTWLFITPSEVIISVATTIADQASLTEFINESKTIYNEVKTSGEHSEKSKKLSDQLAYARAISKTFEGKMGSKFLDDLISGIDKRKISNNALKQIFSIGYDSPYSKNLNKLITKDYEKAKNIAGRDTILSIQERYILQKLNKAGRMDPYSVWLNFEKDTGDAADSLYRIFALGYFSMPPVKDKKVLYDEAFDYLQFYPNSEWSFLERLYALVVPQTTNKNDLELLLDLISYQALKEESHQQLDYKAVILYKLGEKERALSMIQQINAKAMEKRIRYKSMLYAFSKK